MPLTLASRGLVRGVLLAALVAGASACDSGEPAPPASTDQILFGLNYSRLFADASAAEIDAVRASWAARNPTSSNLSVVGEATVGGATIRVVSHTVTAVGCETVTHYAAVRIPSGLTTPAPILVVHHGGDDGFSIGATGDTGLNGVAALYPDLFARTVQVMPVYRSEPLDASAIGLGTRTATGQPSPWNCDVDDAMATVSQVISAYPTVVSATQRAAIGFSRGGATAMLHAVRDAEMDAVVDYYGPTDFLNNPTVEGLTTLAVTGNQGVLNLPGVRYLTESVLLPLRNADGSYNAAADYSAARLELIRRSPGLFASQIPDAQIHHHRGDSVVPFEFSVAFDAVATAGGAGNRVELTLYGPETPEGPQFHSPTAMPESYAPVQTFLRAQLGI